MTTTTKTTLTPDTVVIYLCYYIPFVSCLFYNVSFLIEMFLSVSFVITLLTAISKSS
jgi:hypothetical protein